MIRRLLFILMGIILAVLGVFIALCMAVILTLRGIYLSLRNLILGAPKPPRGGGEDVIEGSFTEVVTPESRAEFKRIHSENTPP